MFARLYAKTGKMAGASYEITSEAIIGHGPECNLVIKSGVLSAKHARISLDEKKGSYFLEDFKTHNGTLLDGKPVNGRVKLERKHVVMFAGTFAFIFQVEQGEPANPLPPPPTDIPAEPEAPHRPINVEGNRPQTIFDDAPDEMPMPHEEPPAPPPVAAPRNRDNAPTMLVDDAQFAELFTAHPKFMVELISVRGEKHAVTLREGENSVGRISGSDVLIDDASISRNHAVIIVKAGKVTLRDLQSKNGTFVEEKKIVADTDVETDMPLRFGLVKASIIAAAPTS